jgi:hypothetical protein
MNHDQQRMLDALMDLESGLTAWEIDFLESIDSEGLNLTASQAEKLAEIYRQRIDRLG